ncbi:MAG: Gfo/Idh/MocA family oxidoreductase [Candidatus Latescibacterota bacterium]|nr:Gfo/Idh/MocA family oxidoreductase [Candidatus Latescibacterota bacterium]
MDSLQPDKPVKIALIGTGNRSKTIYQPLLPALKNWVEVVACVDPVQEHCDSIAEKFSARAYCDVQQMVKDGIAEAALVVTPVPSHYAYSIYLSSHGIHNQCETSWCSLLAQAREMIRVAQENEVVVRVAENFFRFACDRYAQTVKSSGFLGRIGRIFSYADHTGYHNNSRWVRFFGHPVWAQAIGHAMETPSFRSMPHRFHSGEHFQAHYFGFPGGEMVADQLANGKGWLGRHPRPGYTEWQGERGTLLYRAQDPGVGESKGGFTLGKMQLRRCSDAGIDAEHGVETIQSVADEIVDVIDEDDGTSWTRSYADTSVGRIEYANPFRADDYTNMRKDYGTSAMSHIVDFALAVRGLKKSEFDDEDALVSLAMQLACDLSAENEGQRVVLPLADEAAADAPLRQSLTAQYGIDPLDVEGMMAVNYAQP